MSEVVLVLVDVQGHEVEYLHHISEHQVVVVVVTLEPRKSFLRVLGRTAIYQAQTERVLLQVRVPLHHVEVSPCIDGCRV